MSQKKQSRLSLHYLLGALSFWGTSVRVMLMAFLAGTVLLARILVMPEAYHAEIQSFIYIVGSFFVLDTGYVMLARALPFRKVSDMTILLLVDTAVMLAYIVPNIAYAPGLAWLSHWSIVIIIFILSIRALMGLLLANQRKR